jgi:hypothetical protein
MLLSLTNYWDTRRASTLLKKTHMLRCATDIASTYNRFGTVATVPYGSIFRVPRL